MERRQAYSPSNERSPEHGESKECEKVLRAIREARTAAKRTYEEIDQSASTGRRLAELALLYKETRDWPWVRRQLEGIGPTDLLAPDSPLPLAIEDGHGAWVIERLVAIPDATGSSFFQLLEELAGHGHAEWVKRRFSIPSANLSNAARNVVRALCRNGETDWVQERVNRVIPAFQPDTPHDLLIAMVEGGQGAWVAAKVGDARLDPTDHGQNRLLVSMAFFGHESWAIKKVTEAVETSHAVPTKRDLRVLCTRLTQNRPDPAVQAFLQRWGDFYKKPGPRTAVDRLRFEDDELVEFRTTRASHERVETDGVLSDIDKSVSLVLPMPARLPFQQAVVGWTNGLPPAHVPFVRMAKDGAGILSPSMERVVATLGGERSKFVVELKKTGSELHLYGERNASSGVIEITFVHDIAPSAAAAWKVAHDAGIAVAPMLHDSARRPNGRVRVRSRYSGLTAYSYLRELHAPYAFRSWLSGEIEAMKDALATLGVRHGHPHEKNVTVEFVRKEYLAHQVADGRTVNTLPFDETQFTFDALPYFERPDEWTPIVRLIDWDQAMVFHS